MEFYITKLEFARHSHNILGVLRFVASSLLPLLRSAYVPFITFDSCNRCTHVKYINNHNLSIPQGKLSSARNLLYLAELPSPVALKLSLPDSTQTQINYFFFLNIPSNFIMQNHRNFKNTSNKKIS